jgi:DNA-binding NtrC family response regulator
MNDTLQGTTVLLVDDNDRLRAILTRSLQAIGCVVQTANRAEQAIEMLQSGARPQLVLSDVRMPGEIDGVALGHWVVAHVPGTRVLLQTGYSVGASGPFRVLEKPFTLDELIEAIRAVMAAPAA